MIRRPRIVDRLQTEKMSKVLPFIIIVESNGVSTLVKSPKFTSPYAGVPADAFSLSAVIASGGSLTPSPKVSGSNCETRDAVDSSVAALELENQKRLQQKKFDDAYKAFQDAINS